VLSRRRGVLLARETCVLRFPTVSIHVAALGLSAVAHAAAFVVAAGHAPSGPGQGEADPMVIVDVTTETPVEAEPETPPPQEAARAGRDRNLPCARDWKQQRDRVMFRALMCKFTQHLDCKVKLMQTGTAMLVAVMQSDPYWAEYGNVGRNRLGEMLVEVRRRIMLPEVNARHHLELDDHAV